MAGLHSGGDGVSNGAHHPVQRTSDLLVLLAPPTPTRQTAGLHVAHVTLAATLIVCVEVCGCCVRLNVRRSCRSLYIEHHITRATRTKWIPAASPSLSSHSPHPAARTATAASKLRLAGLEQRQLGQQRVAPLPLRQRLPQVRRHRLHTERRAENHPDRDRPRGVVASDLGVGLRGRCQVVRVLDDEVDRAGQRAFGRARLADLFAIAISSTTLPQLCCTFLPLSATVTTGKRRGCQQINNTVSAWRA